MINLYDHSIQSVCKKIECEELLFVEYRCLPGVDKKGIWSHYSHIAYIAHGHKTWISTEGEFNVSRGEALYCKKGGHFVVDTLDSNVCVLLFFLPDEFIRETVIEFKQGMRPKNMAHVNNDHILQLNIDLALQSYFESVMSYFFLQHEPSPHLVKIKFKELILQILTSNLNPELAHYFLSLVLEDNVNLKQTMYDNFLFNLSLDEFARLCNRSLSTFKRDFKSIFGSTPGRWLIEQRLAYAKMRLLTTEENINDIAFHSGFDTASNFIRSFKKSYGAPPQKFRNITAYG